MEVELILRVHELAKELNLKSQEIIDALSGTEHAVSNTAAVLMKWHSRLFRGE
ncbi:MAG: translation initiation factor IF-2 N-terminal domain-containing protein [Lachnospiraceae bacterium]